MLIEANKVVTFHYRMNEPGHDVIDDSRRGSPVVYLHGYQNTLIVYLVGDFTIKPAIRVYGVQNYSPYSIQGQ